MRTVIYARVSTTKQADNDLSIPDQLKQLKSWVQSNQHTIVQEFIEAGASATDDKRPEFQKMISLCLAKPAPVDIIVVHSLSRFFRDAIEFGLYERKLKRNNVQVISITQPTSDDATGELVRRLLTSFDEYSSRENAKHTLRAMKENIAQGFWSGSQATYGYQIVPAEIQVNPKKVKKVLAINEDEAVFVKQIYDFYLYGINGVTCGVKEIAMHLNSKGIMQRGRQWTRQKIHEILSRTVYYGDLYFNVFDAKTKTTKPESEWVKVSVPAIIDKQTFDEVKERRDSRNPDKVEGSRINTNNMLTGILKCGTCGAFMTIATGKSGYYRYYKCTNRSNKGNVACSSKNINADKLESHITQQLANHVFSSHQLEKLIIRFRKTMNQSAQNQDNVIKEYSKQLQAIEDRHLKLLDGVELGVVPLDETTQLRIEKLKASKLAIKEQIDQLKATELKELPIIRTSQIEELSKKIKNKLLMQSNEVRKSFVKLILKEVIMDGTRISLQGKIKYAIGEVIPLNQLSNYFYRNQVPCTVGEWGG